MAVLFLSDPSPSAPFMNAWLRSLGLGLEPNSKLLWLHTPAYWQTCPPRSSCRHRQRRREGSSWPGDCPPCPNWGGPGCCTTRHISVSRTEICFPSVREGEGGEGAQTDLVVHHVLVLLGWGWGQPPAEQEEESCLHDTCLGNSSSLCSPTFWPGLVLVM